MLIGREEERRLLLSLLDSDKSEFVAVYGRRRVGKTYLVRETFNYGFSFQHSGLPDATTKEQLEEFAHSLATAGARKVKTPKNWQDAFFALQQLLGALPAGGKKVLFIDELPWLDTPASKFVAALDHFWNGWATARRDIVLVVCGSATSWVMDKIVMNYGGLHNRLTRQIYLAPFTLHDCEEYARQRNLGMSRRNILETYMVLGGIPYYWDFMRSDLSWAQNIDRMLFRRNGELRHEFDALYRSLFRHPQAYIGVVTALGTKKAGMTRNELMAATAEYQGSTLTKVLRELEQCDFIRSFSAIGKMRKETVYQLIDNFTLFHFKFLANHRATDGDYWTRIIAKPVYSAWSGLAFERVGLQHIGQIKKALGITGIISNVCSWRYQPQAEAGKGDEKGAQIDMVIDRDDNVVNLCEMKFAQGEYAVTQQYDAELRRKMSLFVERTHTRKGVSLVIITSYGIKRNEWSGDIQRQLTMDDLFAE